MFIVFEGGEGCGKTTLRNALSDRLVDRGHQVVQTREPGGTVMAEEIRELLIRHREEKVDPMSEALLFFAGRRQHVELVVKPNIRDGKIVLCDRFIDSTYALQCCGGNLPVHTFDTLVQTTLGDFRPHLTVILDVDPERSFDKIQNRGDLDRLESMGLGYHKRVRQGFLEQMSKDPSRYYLMAGHRDLDTMVDEVMVRAGL